MTIEVKGVSSIVKDVERVKQRATDAADSLKHSIDSVDQALDVVKDLDDTLSDAARELNAVLGVGTNNPPAGEKLEDEETEEQSLKGGSSIGPTTVASVVALFLAGSFLFSSIPDIMEMGARDRAALEVSEHHSACQSLTGLETRLLSICTA